MNKENLIKMAQHVLTIPQEKFKMSSWRSGTMKTPECDSVGCIIGHCTVLDPNIEECMDGGIIRFQHWGEHFTGIDRFNIGGCSTWQYLFDSAWVYYDNTPQGAHDRIMNVVNGLNVTSEHLPWTR